MCPSLTSSMSLTYINWWNFCAYTRSIMSIKPIKFWPISFWASNLCPWHILEKTVYKIFSYFQKPKWFGYMKIWSTPAPTCKWLFTWANVRSFTFISSSTDFGVAPATLLSHGNIYIILVVYNVFKQWKWNCNVLFKQTSNSADQDRLLSTALI